MHELSLYGQVSQDDHERVLKQLAGVARMQPQDVNKLHLVYKARTPPGMEKVQSSGGTQGVQQQDMQRLKNMLSGGLHYVQLVGTIQPKVPTPTDQSGDDQDVKMTDQNNGANDGQSKVQWIFEFKDTPESGKQAASTRMVSRTIIEDGDPVKFLANFGYQYVSRYYLHGATFYDQDTTISLTRALQIPDSAPESAGDVSTLQPVNQLQPLDGSGSYLLQASIDITDGNNQDLKDRAVKQLMQIRDTLRPSVVMTPGDRLALDTRIPNPLRRP